METEAQTYVLRPEGLSVGLGPEGPALGWDQEISMRQGHDDGGSWRPQLYPIRHREDQWACLGSARPYLVLISPCRGCLKGGAPLWKYGDPRLNLGVKEPQERGAPKMVRDRR